MLDINDRLNNNIRRSRRAEFRGALSAQPGIDNVVLPLPCYVVRHGKTIPDLCDSKLHVRRT